MSSNSITVCDEVYYDPGGTGNYSNSATIVQTIYPVNSGDGLCLDFAVWDLDYSLFGYSELSFYDGTSTSSPLIMSVAGDYYSDQSNEFEFEGPGMVCANGPITLEWNPADDGVGWEALISCFTPQDNNSNCNIDLSSDVSEICSGDQVNLTASGRMIQLPFENNFNSSNIGTGWISSVDGLFTNPCGSGVDGTVHFWMGENETPRSLQTNSIDVSNGGVVSFDFKMAEQLGGSPCEGPDYKDEGVFFQYSSSGGSWETIHYFIPSYYTEVSEHTLEWKNYIFNLPLNAQNSGTMFRWIQNESSGDEEDHWGLDNVAISTPTSFDITLLEQSTGNIIASSSSETSLEAAAFPTSSETYVATITDLNSSNTCEQTIDIVVNTCAPPAGSSNPCGTCDDANCDIHYMGEVTDGSSVNLSFPDCINYNPEITSGSIENCYTATSSIDGMLGFRLSEDITQNPSSSGQCFNSDLDQIDATRTYTLKLASGGCGASPILPDNSNVNNSATLFNPEWYNLQPNTDYILCTSVEVVSPNCQFENLCMTYYHLDESNSSCNANVGTIFVDINGNNVSGNDVDIPYGETATFNASGYILPNDGTGTSGMSLALFNCEPQPASLISPFDVQSDPCYEGTAFNDNVPTTNNGTGTSSLGEVWAVFMTFDNASTGGGPDTDGDDCVDVSAVYHITYLPENPPPSSDCGSCSTPDCDVGNVLSYDDRLPDIAGGLGAQVCVSGLNITDTYTSYQTITSDGNGNVGAYVQLLELDFLADVTNISHQLYSLSDCGGTIIPTSNFNSIVAGGSTDNVHNRSINVGLWNPEWTGLVPSTDYILVTTFTVVGGTLSGWCMDYYWDPSSPPPTPGPCEMQNGSVTTCDCEFTDSGGSSSDYGSSENSTFTICPDQANARIELEFSSFETQSGDILEIYDGNIASGQPIIIVSGNNPVELQTAISATLSNTSGCLTVVFQSNSSDESSGWIADVSCLLPCTLPVADATVNGASTQSVKICQGDQVNFDGSSSVHNGSNMDTYSWDFGNQTTGFNPTESVTYNNPGRYVPTLVVENDEGCISTNALPYEILVSTEAIFTGTTADQTACLGAEVCLDAEVTYPISVSAPVVPPTGTVALPDGTGVAYETTVLIEGYSSGQTISSASDLQSVCVEMEHSALDDITITLIAPTGESVQLHNRGGGASALGIPSLDANAFSGSQGCDFGGPSSGPGTGWLYCFNSSGIESMAQHGDDNWNYPNNICYQIPAGDYSPVEAFSNLNGADLNGTWTLRYEDASGNDDGYMFSWDLIFNPSLLPTSATIDPIAVTQSWAGPSAVISNDNDIICVSPDLNGLSTYTFTVTNDFGCSADTSISVDVTESITNTVNETICNGDTVEYYGTLYHATNLTGTHLLSASSGCDSIITYNVIEESPITSTINESICDGGNFVYYGITYDASNPTGLHVLTSSSGCDSTVTFSITEESPITNTVNEVICNGAGFDYYGTTYNVTNPIGIHVLTSSLGCDSTVTFSITEESPITNSVNESICNGASFVFDGTTYNSSNPTGIHVLTTSSGCDSTITFSISEQPPITSSVDETICETGYFIYNGTTYDQTNTTGIHVLTSTNGCDSTVTVNITIQSSSTSVLDTMVCYGESLTVNGNTYDSSNPTGQEILSSSIGCDSIVSINIVELIPDTSFIDTVIYVGQSLDIAGQVLVESDFEGLVYIQSITSGCDSIVSAKVKMLYESAHFVPTGFSPNGDGNNDVIGVMGGGITEINFYIYNRWGEKVFSYVGDFNGFCPDDPLCNWDGTYKNQAVNVETYVYYLKGTYSNGEEFIEKGTISLIK